MQRDADQARRVELVLQQLDALPTLSPIAVRIVELTTDDRARAEDVIELVSSDPALAGRVLQASRRADRARGEHITTVDRAVLHLGFDAVRSAALSLQVFELFDGPIDTAAERAADETASSEIGGFDRIDFWRHCLATACLGQLLAARCRAHRINPAEAFLAGLLHDLGALALHVVLPRSMDRVCRIAASQGLSLGAACATVIGVPVTTAGKRLAERWRLPHSLTDVLWLHGQRYDSLPDLPHRPLIALVTLADMLARSRYIPFAGHGPRDESPDELCERLGLDRNDIDAAAEQLAAAVAQRMRVLGLDECDEASPEALLRALGRANQSLGRTQADLRRRAEVSHRLSRTLERIIRFHESTASDDSLFTVLERVVQSARETFMPPAEITGTGFCAMLVRETANRETNAESWQLIQFSSESRAMRSDLVALPGESLQVGGAHVFDDATQLSIRSLGLLPWLTDYLGDARDLRDVRLLPLRTGGECIGVLLHEGAPDADAGNARRSDLQAMTSMWARAIASAIQHDAVRRLGEELADANRMLIEMQDALARKQAAAALGEVIAGAAHEMNNPLTIISGRCQQLASELAGSSHASMATQVVAQAHRLSDMLSALREMAESAAPRRRDFDLAEIVQKTAGRFREPASGKVESPPSITVLMPPDLPVVHLDPSFVQRALEELIRNAQESKGSRHIEVVVQIEAPDDRLMIRIRDDGAGLSPHALTHAFEPFFSEKPAGRQPGLGLSRARRFVQAHGGVLTLTNVPKNAGAGETVVGGAEATIRFDHWKAAQHSASPARKAA